MKRSAASRRRAKFGAMTLVLVLATCASLFLINVLAKRFVHRFDVTSTREHQLSPRSKVLVGTLKGDYEIVIAAPLKDPRAVDRRALARLVDVLDQFKRASSRGASIATTLIDTGSADGAARYAELLDRLRSRDQAKLDKQVTDLQTAQSSAESFAEWLEAVVTQMTTLRGMLPSEGTVANAARAYLDRRAAECRSSSAALRDLAGRSRTALSSGRRPGRAAGSRTCRRQSAPTR